MNKFVFFITLIFTLSIFNFVKAQEIAPEVFRTIKDAKIVIPPASRNFEKINFDYMQLPAAPQEYKTEDVAINVPELTTKIRVVTITPPPLPKLYGNYVKGGFGNYTTPYLEAFLNNKRSENLSYGLHLKHFSSKNGPVKFSGFSENKANAYLKYFTKKFQFNSSLHYDRDRFNYYGFNQALPVENDTLKRVFNTFALKAGIKNLNQDSKLSYDTRFAYYNFRDNFKAREDEYLGSFAGGYKLDDDKLIRVDADLSISKYKDSSETNRGFFQIKPALVYTFGKYKFTGGFNAAYTTDTVNTAKFHLYPRFNVDIELFENTLIAFGGIEGEMQKNTLRSFTRENPFLQPDVFLLHSNKSLEVYAGVKGNYSGVNYKARMGYSNYKNLYFFNNSPTDSSKFSILYDRNTTVLNLGGNLSYEVAETFRVGLNLDYFNYNTGSLEVEKPWHRPNFVSSLSASYNLYKKIYINTDIYYISGLTGKNYISGKEVKLDGIVDLNLKVDYKFSSAFSAFLELNNILSKKYQRYLYYPVKGINVIGGIAYSF